MTNQINFPNAVVPLEALTSFNHDGLVPPQSSAAPMTQPSSTPVEMQPPLTEQPVQPQQQPPVLAAQPQDSYVIDERVWDTAQRLGKCLLVPAPLRDSVSDDRTAERYLLLMKAKSIGIAMPDAFTELFVLYSPNKGEAKIGMYVRTKAALCAKAGKWTVNVDLVTGDAVATGYRFSDQHRIEVRYTAYEASLRGMLTRDANGNVAGCSMWRDKWPDMMRTRALGRLLDALFPEIICNVDSKEDFDDMEYAEQLQTQAKAPQTAEKTAPASVADIVAKARRAKTVVANKEEQAPLLPQAASNDGVLINTANSPQDLPPNPFADAAETSA